jgi:hypothetical protein
MRKKSVWISCWVASAVAAACAPEAAPGSCFGRTDQALTNGSPETGSELLNAALSGAIGRAYVHYREMGVPVLLGTCSLTRISSRWALTARHCLPPEGGSIQVSFLPQQTSCLDDPLFDDLYERATVTRVVPHPDPDVDLALLELRQASSRTVGLSETKPTEASRLLMAGFGYRRDGSSGVLEFLNAEVVAETDALLKVTAGPDRGACGGDSGGPLLEVNDAGSVLVGVLTSGSRTCTEYDLYIPVADHLEWITSFVEAS